MEEEFAEEVATEPERRGPEDRAGGVRYKEIWPGHPVHSGQEGCKNSQQSDKPAEEDEFKITRKDERGRDYRTCPQCGFHMYKQDRTWTCENCGYSYTE